MQGRGETTESHGNPSRIILCNNPTQRRDVTPPTPLPWQHAASRNRHHAYLLWYSTFWKGRMEPKPKQYDPMQVTVAFDHERCNVTVR